MTENVLSWPVLVDGLAVGEDTPVGFVADEKQRVALASRLGLSDVAEFRTDFVLLRKGGDRVKASGRLRARVTQICVVSLDPFETVIDETFDLAFAPAADAEAEAQRQAHEPLPGQSIAELPDPPDPIVNGKIDLGVLAEEFLSLGLDPYPRKPGVDFEPPASDSAPDESPFAALDSLRPAKK